ncbi:uncharacterized protein [Dermacentor andersoni]|uniref:uncharacterized protein isoform X1 n=1 Tax=Dermacentor andersoni TaxID=34620 RepID=UPI002415E6A5|nr:uncharacterized protein LOC126540313 isoform X1 [Dermacentor andersoni]
MRASSWLVCLAVLSSVGIATRRQRFVPCGKGHGVVTTSRGAALITKVINKCGRLIPHNYAWNISTTVKMIRKACVAVRLCYASHSTTPKKNPTFKKAIFLCLRTWTTTFYKIIPAQFMMSPDLFNRLETELRSCMSADIIPEDADVVLAAAKRYLKIMNIVGNPLGST